MPPPRRARSPNGARVRYADESDAEEDQDAPVRQRSGLRKRLSEAYPPDADGSFISESAGPRVPLKNVNMNDDEAEKRRRRKSAKVVLDGPVAGPSSEGTQDAGADSSRSAAKGKQPLNSVVPQQAVKPSMDVMSSNFEEWMKMATDNKINAGNSWNVALIDYFHDMSLLRNQDDNSINFQRASCTLDGCVKIWTSRVDSIGTETGKLLSNLASGGKDDDDEEGNNSDNPDGPSQPKKKKARTGNNLAKDFDALKGQKLDLEFSVDPLFKKTCADFDEGGAQGLLMNHLCLGLGGDGGMRVIFDASDSVFKEEDEVPEEPVNLIDISYLRSNFLPDIAVLEDKAISHTLAGFSFSKDFQPELRTFAEPTMFDDVDDNDSDGGVGGNDFQMDVDQAPEDTQDFFAGGDDGGNEDYTFGAGNDMGGDDDAQSNGSVGPTPPGQDGGPGHFVPFDPRRTNNEREFILAMDPDGEGLDYLDAKFRKNWAGPEHWKMQRIIQRSEFNFPNADAAGSKATKPKTKKEPVKIDFLTPAEKDLKALKAELFAPAGKGTSINLPGTGASNKKGKKKKEKSDHRLPDDMHFSSKQLITLFTKPKYSLRMRGMRARLNNDDGEIDEAFWAEAAANRAREQNQEDEDGPSGDAPFSTQFFNDDDDDGPAGFDDMYGDPSTVEPGEQDLLAATHGQTRRVKPEFVNYAKRAKRVDVRKLKENIWKGLDIVISKPRKDEEDSDEEMVRRAPTDPNEARQFSQVMSGLTKSYPKDKLEEISTSFCFICLLHLANEQGLRLEASNGASIDTIIPDDEDDEIAAETSEDNDIWGIKIYRDPNATQSA
ncbi:barren [Coprinopsis marcescibilis]|uniref:Condensin complex subunit 2 n=1 Tax=Coprinopsis marcescibilis TaxID=230819 RepID=A0A5C3KZ61_COPMA|nr:barren [Coprinopsis marcescibilis]